MHQKPVNQLPRPAIDRLIASIPFYKQLRQQDDWQFELLLLHSCVATFAPGEVVLERGSRDSWLYFLLKGQLQVLAGELPQTVNCITPGEVFGDMAMLLRCERSATVVVDEHCREGVVFGTDFSIFGALEDIHTISLATKLLYYRNLAHSLRWKLEVYRSQYPQHALAERHRAIALYRGAKESMAELTALNEQARQLAELLMCWNQEFGRLAMEGMGVPSRQLLAEISSLS